MKKYFQFWFVWLCSVLIAFTLQQVLFLAYNYKQLSGVSFIEIIESFWVARKLNYAMFCYTSAIPFLIYIIQLNTTKQLLRLFMLSYASAIFIIFFSLSTAELSLYQEWGSKLNFKALNYLKNPSEIIHTASLSFALLFILLVVLQTLLSLYFLKKYLPSPLPSINGRWNNKAGYSLINFIVGLFLIVIGLRGGLQQIPINQSVSYFSKHNILNLAATNTVFNAIHSVLQNKKTTNTNIYKVLDNNEAVTIVKKMHTPLKDTTLFFLKNNRPNIFIFLLDGWAGDAVGACNGDSSLTPFINQIANKGINFERCYASGNRSDQGIAAVFSSFPAQSLTSIIEQPDKFSKLP
ncbi:MAG: hypothetical protein IT239_04695, partial [Bacteroidia bacterium]|nr:hypothetical protein [Bacteroidia bacterium]